VTAVIRGADGPNAEEVLSLGHLFEQGAHDNATVSPPSSARETLNRLIKAGKLPRPKRSIPRTGNGRVLRHKLFTSSHNKDRVKRTIAAMCIDSPAADSNTSRAPNIPGFSIRIPPSLTSMRWLCGSQKSITRS
jgi:hypothetical protein